MPEPALAYYSSAMKRLRVVVSLITRENDYQVEQAAAAEDAARRLGIDVEVLYADGDAIQQSQQILKFVQAEPESRPDGIILEPAGGTGLPQVARAAAVNGISWAVMNRELEYVRELRRSQQRVHVCGFHGQPGSWPHSRKSTGCFASQRWGGPAHSRPIGSRRRQVPHSGDTAN